MIALILIPTAVAIAFGGLRVGTSAANAESYRRVEKLAELGSHVTALANELSTERAVTAAYIATNRDAKLVGSVRQQYAKTDGEIGMVRRLSAGVDESYGSETVASTTRVRNRLDDIINLRTNAVKTRMPGSAIGLMYTESINDLLAFNEVISQEAADEDLAQTAHALVAVSRIKEGVAQEQGMLYQAAASHSMGDDLEIGLGTAWALETIQLQTYRGAASPEQRALYDDTVIGPQVNAADMLLFRGVMVGLRDTSAKHFDLDPKTTKDADEWLMASQAKIDRLSVVERKLTDEVIAVSKAGRKSAVQSAIVGAVVVAVVLILVFIITLVMAQSLVTPLRRLRNGALDVAGNRLPDLVRRLRDPEVGDEPLQVDPIDVHTTDEIGQVARSFDEVHREAVRLASNEALLRGNVNAMFVNLSRRSQSLIERQLRLIEDLEQSEQDSGRLDSLFKLDHLATRMRRNCENLLVLGGQDQARRWNQPVPLVDIVRASLSEVEQYERITLRIQDEVSVNGRTVNDLVHLVAELVENSTSFSPEHTKVAVSGHLLSGGGAMLQISDNGVGMSPEELEEANWRLGNPPTIDVSVSRRMGLFVVGRLAQRHGIRVELRAALSGGITAFVILPPNAIMQDPSTVKPQRLEALLESPDIRAAVSPPAVQPLAARTEPGAPVEPARPSVPNTPRDPVRAQGTSLPKRKPAPTAPPGRGNAPTAPSHSGPPRPQAPPPASRPPVQPSAPPPPAPQRPPAQSQPAASSVTESRSANENNGRSPIFEAMQSEWFQRRKTGSMNHAEPPPPPEWSSPGDEGWRAAETVRSPSTGGQTNTGLPKRVPGNNRIPGSVGPAVRAEGPAPGQGAPSQGAAPAPAPRAPQAEAVRNRFASFQQGVRKGRAAIRPEDDERENQ